MRNLPKMSALGGRSVLPAVRVAARPIAVGLSLWLVVTTAIALAPACAATTRADTLQTATLTVVAARDALIAYDGPHELELARTGTPDQAAAALTAYRAKRATATKAFVAAVDAIVLAGGLNDQPSLAGVAKAIAEVIADYKQLKGMP